MGDPGFALITLDVIKSMCVDRVEADVMFVNTAEGKNLLEELEDMNCIMDCNQKGQCVKGRWSLCMCITVGKYCSVIKVINQS